jgi:DNA polymerase III gamma/tau subunit
VLAVDPARITDPEIAGESERDRLKALVARFSREDLLRAFDLLTKAEADIRVAAQPRYNLEMALLRWMYLRKLTPIEDLISGAAPTTAPATRPPSRLSTGSASAASRATSTSPSPSAPASKPAAAAVPSPPAAPGTGSFKDALLGEIRQSKRVFYNMVVAQAQKIDVTADRVTFTFSSAQRALRDQFEQQRSWLESIAHQIAGRNVAVAGVLAESGSTASAPAAAPSVDQKAADRKSALKEQALADAGVQAMLEIFPAEIRDVEEM